MVLQRSPFDWIVVALRSVFLFLTAVGLFQCWTAALIASDLTKFVVVVPMLMFLMIACMVWFGSRRGQISARIESSILMSLGFAMTSSYGAILVALGTKCAR